MHRQGGKWGLPWHPPSSFIGLVSFSFSPMLLIQEKNETYLNVLKLLIKKNTVEKYVSISSVLLLSFTGRSGPEVCSERCV